MCWKAVCAGSSQAYGTASNTGRTYTWVVTGGTIASGQGTSSINVTWGTGAAGSVVVTEAITASSCAVTTSAYNVTINANPTPTIGGLTTVCSGASATYTTPSNTGRTYSWTVTGGTIASGQGTNSISVNWGSAGTGTVVVSETITATTCNTTTNAYNVNINANPAPVITGATSVCAGGSNTYSTPSNSARIYTWTVTGGTITSGQGSATVTVMWGSAGSASLIVKDSLTLTGCIGITTAYNVTINAVPTPSITGPTAICSGGNGIYLGPTSVSSNYNWVVTGGTITSGQGTNGIVVNWPNAGTGTVVLTETNTTVGCAGASPGYTVTVNAKPAPVVSGMQNVCAGSNGFYSTGFNTGHTYTWTITGGTIATGQGSNGIAVMWGGAGSGSLMVTDSVNTTGCMTSTPAYSVTVNANPTPSVSGPVGACAGSSVVYTTPANTGRTYNWMVVGGTVASGQNTNSATITWGSAGAGLVMVTDSVTASGCKTTSASVIVNINANPDPTVSGADVVCEGGSYTYTVPANQGRTYNWMVTGGTVHAGQGSSTVGIIWNTGITSGTIMVSDSVNASGCVGVSPVKTITINALPVPVITGNNQVCSGAQQDYSTPSNSGRTYTWTVVNGQITAGAGTSNITVRWANTGAGFLTVRDSNTVTGCYATTPSMNINVNATPTALVTGSQKVCNHAVETYSVDTGSGHSFTWVADGGTIVSGQNTNMITVRWNLAGTGHIGVADTVMATGCAGASLSPITVNALPNAGFSTSQAQGAVTFTPAQSGNTCNWKFGDGDSSNVNAPTHTYAANSTYQVTLHASNADGCSSDSTVAVVVNTVGLQSVLAGKFEMSVYPNPFHGKTLISFTMKETSNISLDVFDLTGRLVKTYVTNQSYKAGLYEFTFDAGELQTSSSVYMVRLRINENTRFVRIVESDRN